MLGCGDIKGWHVEDCCPRCHARNLLTRVFIEGLGLALLCCAAFGYVDRMAMWRFPSLTPIDATTEEVGLFPAPAS